jgi:hypothetical protein
MQEPAVRRQLRTLPYCLAGFIVSEELLARPVDHDLVRPRLRELSLVRFLHFELDVFHRVAEEVREAVLFLGVHSHGAKPNRSMYRTGLLEA